MHQWPHPKIHGNKKDFDNSHITMTPHLLRWNFLTSDDWKHFMHVQLCHSFIYHTVLRHFFFVVLIHAGAFNWGLWWPWSHNWGWMSMLMPAQWWLWTRLLLLAPSAIYTSLSFFKCSNFGHRTTEFSPQFTSWFSLAEIASSLQDQSNSSLIEFRAMDTTKWWYTPSSCNSFGYIGSDIWAICED